MTTDRRGCSPRLPRRQRGVALIAAVLVVALALVLVAALLDTGEATRARSRNALRSEQTWQLMQGLEAWAALALRSDHDEAPGNDSPGEAWTGVLGPLAIPGGEIHGRLRQQSGCFNLNSLYRSRNDEPNIPYERLERLLRALKLDPAIAAQIRDWIDEDGEAGSGGAEDLRYSQRQPPMRARNGLFTHVSELRLLPAVDADAYRALQPHVCALPPETPTNWNFAAPVLWMSLDDGIGESAARRLARDGHARYADAGAIVAELPTELRHVLGAYDGVHTEYFIADAEIIVDGIPYAYSSLLHRDPGTGRVRVVSRSRGRL